MKAKRVFHPHGVLADTQSGRSGGPALRRVGIARDATPRYLKERLARGIGVLGVLGDPCNYIKRMLRRWGVIETINRTASHSRAAESFRKLCVTGLKHLSAESVVLDRPHLFLPAIVKLARSRLGR